MLINMADKIKIRKLDIAFALVLVFLFGFIAGVKFAPQNIQPLYSLQISGERIVNMSLPAVDNEGNGVVGTLFTTVKPGTGKILLDTSKVLNYIDTQLSGRTAASAAGNYARINMSNVDIIYTIKVNASIIEGPSAGGSMAVSVLFALNNRTPLSSVFMTGTINPDGSIGSVGAILEKARAAKDHGAKVFLVPKGQSTTESGRRESSCNIINSMNICRITYTTNKTDIGRYMNITIHEVANIGEAYGYFLNETE